MHSGRRGAALFDRFGPTLHLVGATYGLSDAKQLLDVAELTGLPIRHVVLDDPRLCQLYCHSLVLVRPDLHIAWRGTSVRDPAEIVDRARGMRRRSFVPRAGTVMTRRRLQ